MKEFFDAIKGQLSERLANPFTGAFCIAWVVWNFRLLMVFAGKGTYQEKFLYIDTSLYPDWRYWALRGVAIPIVTAVVYLLAYPWATRWLIEHYRKQQTEANNAMKAAEGAALLSVEDSRKLRTKYAEAEQAWQRERDQLTEEIDARKETEKDLAGKLAELRDEVARTNANASLPQVRNAEEVDDLAITSEAGLGKGELANSDKKSNKFDPLEEYKLLKAQFPRYKREHEEWDGVVNDDFRREVFERVNRHLISGNHIGFETRLQDAARDFRANAGLPEPTSKASM